MTIISIMTTILLPTLYKLQNYVNSFRQYNADSFSLYCIYLSQNVNLSLKALNSAIQAHQMNSHIIVQRQVLYYPEG